MEKITAFLLSALLLLSLAACGGPTGQQPDAPVGGVSDPVSPSGPAQQPTPERTPEPTPEPLPLDPEAAAEQLWVECFGYPDGRNPQSFVVIHNDSPWDLKVEVAVRIRCSDNSVEHIDPPRPLCIESGGSYLFRRTLLDCTLVSAEVDFGEITEADFPHSAAAVLWSEVSSGDGILTLELTNSYAERAKFLEIHVVVTSGDTVVGYGYAGDVNDLFPGDSMTKDVEIYPEGITWDGYRVYISHQS